MSDSAIRPEQPAESAGIAEPAASEFRMKIAELETTVKTQAVMIARLMHENEALKRKSNAANAEITDGRQQLERDGDGRKRKADDGEETVGNSQPKRNKAKESQEAAPGAAALLVDSPNNTANPTSVFSPLTQRSSGSVIDYDGHSGIASSATLSLLAAQNPKQKWFVMRGISVSDDGDGTLMPTKVRAITNVPRAPTSKPKKAAKKQPAQPAVPTEPTGEECAWCMKRTDGEGLAYAATHKLVRCVWPSREGDIPGCPVCNTMEHKCQDCPGLPPRHSPQFQVAAYNVLVHHRASLLPIRTDVAWPELAVNLPAAWVPRHGHPATKAFALAEFEANRARFERFHEDGDQLPFLEDEATRTLADVKENLDALKVSEVYVPVEEKDKNTEDTAPRTL